MTSFGLTGVLKITYIHNSQQTGNVWSIQPFYGFYYRYYQFFIAIYIVFMTNERVGSRIY